MNQIRLAVFGVERVASHAAHALQLCVHWYIAITTLVITAVFLEYLRQFLIDLHQIYRHSSVPKNTSQVHFFQLLSWSGFTARRRRDFFLSICASPGVASPSIASH